MRPWARRARIPARGGSVAAAVDAGLALGTMPTLRCQGLMNLFVHLHRRDQHPLEWISSSS